MEKKHQDLKKKLALIVKTQRKAMGLSQEGLADLCEIDRTYTSQIERGVANPSLKVLCSLSTVLQLTLSQLLGESQIP